MPEIGLSHGFGFRPIPQINQIASATSKISHQRYRSSRAAISTKANTGGNNKTNATKTASNTRT